MIKDDVFRIWFFLFMESKLLSPNPVQLMARAQLDDRRFVTLAAESSP
jgi:hypothetical protein